MTSSLRLPETVLTPGARTTVFHDVTRMADSWDTLGTASGSPTHHFAWVSACAETFAGSSALRIVVLGDPERPAAFAPLVVRRRDGVPRLELIGVHDLHEPMDLIFRSPSDASELAESLVQLGVPLRLDRVPAESPTAAQLKHMWHRRGVIISRPAPGWPWIALDHRWRDHEPPLEAGRRSDLRRAYRNAEKLGPVSCQILSPSPQELDTLLDEVFRVEAANWKGKEGTALACDPLRSAFFRRYAAAACLAGILRLCFLRIGDQIAATQFAVESDQRFWLLKIGYDETFARCSPGTLLLRETVRYAATLGLRSYEFLGAPEPWTRSWTEHVRPCLSIRAYPFRPLGLAALVADVARSGWRRISGLFSRAR